MPQLHRRLEVAFALSGFAATVYEVLWVRSLGDLFGHTAYAIQIVLAVFFGGVAIGSFLTDRVAWWQRNLLRYYAGAELALAFTGIVFPYVIALATPLYDHLAPIGLGGGRAFVARLVAATLLFIVPTTLMGATFPLVVRWRQSRAQATSGIATLYAVNTLGAASGAWLSAFVLLPALGVTETLLVAAAANLLSASLALTLAPTPSGDPVMAPVREDRSPSMFSVGALRVFLFFSGLTALALEVLWIRALDQVLSGTVYSFATVLAVFLVGLALGSKAYGQYGARFSPFALLVGLELLLAGYIAVSPYLIRAMPLVTDRLGTVLTVGFISRGIVLESLLCSVLLLLPASCLGVLFPLLLDFGRALPMGDSWGSLVGANTVGSLLGPLVAGTVLLPALGLKSSLLWMASVPWALAVGVAFFIPLRTRGWLAIAGASAILTLLISVSPDFDLWTERGERLIDHREDPAAAVSVVEYGQTSRQTRLKVNRNYSLGGGRGVFTERRQGHLPMLLHPMPERVLVLGVGTGNTLGAVSLHHPRSLLAVELVRGVVDLARRHFTETNELVLDNPRVQILQADARRVVRAPPEAYEVIIADVFHPWQAGIGSLYSREHFEAVRRALAPGGIFCQWLPLYQLSPEDLGTIVRTFLFAYPEVTGWLGNFGTTTPILALVGSEQPVRVQWERWERAMAVPELAAKLRAVYLDRPAEVVGGYIGGRAELAALAGVGALNTIAKPTIEFSAPRALFAETLQAAKRRSLEGLIRLDRGNVPIERGASGKAPRPEEVRSHVETVRLLIHAFLEQEAGHTGAALRLGLESVRRAQRYDIPAMALVGLAWGAHETDPELAEQAFREALRVRPDDVSALTGLGTVCLSMRRLDSAAEAFRHVLDLRADWPAAVEGLRRVHRLEGSR